MRNLASFIVIGALLFAQSEPPPVFRTNVQMVVLTFSVTDSKGRAVSGLKPEDVRIFEDGVPQRIAAFAEGSKTVMVGDGDDTLAGASIFVLFNTSNQMYQIFPYVYDAVAAFVRSLDPADSVAIYTFSRNLSRAARLTNDHQLARAELSNVVAGDDTALFNSVLLTLRDAAKVPGRKAVVVFSNGPDNASMVAPNDVARVAEDEGVPVYIISTQDPSGDKTSTNALRLLTTRSGGKLYWAPRWQDQNPAFKSVHQDISTSYTAYYYPAVSAGSGFRQIDVQLTAPDGKNWHVRARAGYQAKPALQELHPAPKT